MATKMTHAARAELTNAVRRRYGAASCAEKRKILDEFIAVTGYHPGYGDHRCFRLHRIVLQSTTSS
jgi:hypothetical protein